MSLLPPPQPVPSNKTASQFPLDGYKVGPTDDVRVIVYSVDDRCDVLLNNSVIGQTQFGKGPLHLSLKNGLNIGANSLRFIVNNNALVGANYWSINYEVGIYDQNDKPIYPGININIAYQDNQGGVRYDAQYPITRV